MTDADFTLDRVENPHPRMRQRALELRTRARITTEHIRHASPASLSQMLAVLVQWHAYREAMCDATGCTPTEIDAWLDRELEPVTETLPL